MKNVNSSALKWSAEDLVSNLYRAYKNGDIDQTEYDLITAMSEDSQLGILEGIFEDLSEYLIETINNDIYGALVDRYNQSKKAHLKWVDGLTNKEIMDRILNLKMTKSIDVREEIIRLQQIIDERTSNN